MGSLNKVQLIGYLGADPELRYTPSNRAVCSLSIATSEVWKDKDGKKQERTEWTRCQVWGAQAENCSKFLAKGRQVYVEGRLQTRSWDDKNGQKRYSTEVVVEKVVFLGGGGDGQGQGSGGGGRHREEHAGRRENTGWNGPSDANDPPLVGDDDIPF